MKYYRTAQIKPEWVKIEKICKTRTLGQNMYRL